MADGGEFSECEEVTDDRPIRQGDIFEWLEASNDPWKNLGVVVTANCDIAQEKHRGLLSYVPILPITDYLRLFHLPSLLERGIRPLAEELTKKIRRYQATNLPDLPQPVSEQAILEWVRQAPIDEVTAELRIADPKDRAHFAKLLEDYLLAQTALENEDFQRQIDALTKIRARPDNAPPERTQEQLWKDVQSAMDRLPGDSFFVGQIGTSHSSGHIAYLRLVREIQYDQIAIKHTDLRKQSVLAKRIARLQSPYVYRLTQQLVDVFASIGLPDEYAENRRRLVEALATNSRSLQVAQPEQAS